MVLDSIGIFIIIQILLLIPSFFFYKRKIKKYSKKHFNKLALLAVFIMPIIFTITFGSLIIYIVDPIWRSKEFNSKLWKEDKSVRYRMVKSLETDNLLIGKTKNEVIKLLGTEYNKNCASWVGKKTMCYVAYDPDDIGFLDHYEFVVCIDSNNIVYKVSYEYV